MWWTGRGGKHTPSKGDITLKAGVGAVASDWIGQDWGTEGNQQRRHEGHRDQVASKPTFISRLCTEVAQPLPSPAHSLWLAPNGSEHRLRRGPLAQPQLCGAEPSCPLSPPRAQQIENVVKPRLL